MAYYLIAIFLIILCRFYLKRNNAFKHWEKRNIKGPKPNLIFGNFTTVVTQNDAEMALFTRIYNEFPAEKVIGVYEKSEPAVIIKDPELIRQVLVKNFHVFSNRGLPQTTSKHPFVTNLFHVDYKEWKILRQKLSPVFTAGKLKQMMPLLNMCVRQYMMYLDKLLERSDPVEMRTLTDKFTLKTITTIAFGLDVDTFQDNSQFSIIGDKIFKPLNAKRFLREFVPEFLKELVPIAPYEIVEFFFGLVRQIIKEREGKPKLRKDFMDFMIDLKEQGKVVRATDDEISELEITDAVVASQAFIFYTAGFETSSGAMSFLLYELAMNPDIQERCYKEINSVFEKNKGELTYESLQDLIYLSMVMDETLRKYPVGGVLFRQSLADFEIPELKLTLKKGTRVFITVLGLHRDSKYYPHPEKFDPERFSPENRQAIQDCTYLPFGDGPRNCIGLRFARVQSLLCLAHFLRRFRVEPCEKTVRKIEFVNEKIMLTAKGGIWVTLKHRR